LTEKEAEALLVEARNQCRNRWARYTHLAAQDYSRLLDVLDVKSNLEFALRADGAVPDQAYLMEICSLLGIRHKLDAMPGELSGGERQRAAVARAVAARPALLLADEPTGSLDRKTGLDVLALLRRMNLEFGQTIVMATHSLEAAQMAGRIIHIRDGSVEMPH